MSAPRRSSRNNHAETAPVHIDAPPAFEPYAIIDDAPLTAVQEQTEGDGSRKRRREGSGARAGSRSKRTTQRNVNHVVRAARLKQYARNRPHLDTPETQGQAQVQAQMQYLPMADGSYVDQSLNAHFEANIDPALADIEYNPAMDTGDHLMDNGTAQHQQPPQYVNGVDVGSPAHPPLAPGQTSDVGFGSSASHSSKKARGVTRFWLNNSSIAASRMPRSRIMDIQLPADRIAAVHAQTIGQAVGTETLSTAQADAARAQQAAAQQQQTEMSLRQGANKFGRRSVADASRARARDDFTINPHFQAQNAYGSGIGVGVGVGVGVGAGLEEHMQAQEQDQAYPPMNIEGEQQEFELPYDIQWAAENGELDNKKRPSTYQMIRSNYYGERTRIPATNGGRVFDETVAESMANAPRFSTKVQWTSDKGYGLFAQEDIPAGQFVIDYRGEIISLKTYLSRCAKQYTKSNCFYAIGYDQDEVLDAGIRANEARFINHSCMPNLQLFRASLLPAGLDEFEFGFRALRDIAAGEELTYDYNETTFLPAKQTECRCGAPNCVKVLGRQPGDKTRREFRLVDAIRRSARKANTERITRKTLRAKGESAAMLKYKAELYELRRLRNMRHAEADALLDSQNTEVPVEEPAPPPAPTKKRKGKGRKADDNAPPMTAEEAAKAAEEAKKARISGWAEWLRKKAGEQTRTAEEWLEFANKRRRGKAWMQRMMQDFGVAEYPGGPALPFVPTIEIPKNGQPNKRGPPPGTPRPPRQSKKDRLAKAAEAAAAEQQQAVEGHPDAAQGEPGSSTGPGTHEGDLAAVAAAAAAAYGDGEAMQEHQHQLQHEEQPLEQGQDQGQEAHEMHLEQGNVHQLEQQPEQEPGQEQGEQGVDMDAAIDPALIAALVEHHQRQAEYDAGQPQAGQQLGGPGVGVGIGVGVGVGAGAGASGGDGEAQMHVADGVAYDEHGNAVVGDGYDFFAEVGAADEAALSALAAAQGALEAEAEQQHQHEQGAGLLEEHNIEDDAENDALRQQAEDIVSSIQPRHMH